MSRKSHMPAKTRHSFFLNPYEEYSFSRCPQCNAKTMIRKFPLVIHIDPSQFLFLNKSCKYCPTCDLIIAKRVDVESLMSACCEKFDPSIMGNKYRILGTLNKVDWKQHNNNTTNMDVLDKVFLFKDFKDFEVIPGGWRKG